MKTRAALLHEDLRLEIGERELPEPGGDEARVRVEWAGLCGSDLHVMRTGAWVETWPATLGHEVFGSVESAGGEVDLEPGTRVVIDSRLPCLRCETCADDPDACSSLHFLGEARPGGFADYVMAPRRSLHAVPDHLPGEDAVLAEPLAVVLHAMAALEAPPEQSLILGAGPIGALAHIELLRRFPDARVSVIERAPLRAELAAALGARLARSASEPGDERFDLVIEAAGYEGALSDAVHAAGPGATVLALAISDRAEPIRPIDLIEKRITIRGFNAFVDELPQAIDRLTAEAWRYRPIVTEAISLDELPPMVARQLAEPEAVKVLVHP